MKLLITGSRGFIGTYAVKAAKSRGWNVYTSDVRDSLSNWDVRRIDLMGASHILHLAAFSSNDGFADNLAENYNNNVCGMMNVLRLAQKSGARVVYASSSAVYGNYIDHEMTQDEQDILAPTSSHYAKSKLICEMMAESFRETGVSALGLRIFNAYGKGDELKGNRCAPMAHMVRAKREGKPFVCFGDGSQAKDFIHVSDVVEIIMRLIESDATGWAALTGPRQERRYMDANTGMIASAPQPYVISPI